jgi:acyl carrier protein
MMGDTKKVSVPRVPTALRGRPPCDLEDFVGRHFASGPPRNAARELWRLLEEDLGIRLSELHPDDNLASILGSKNWDSLDIVEVTMALGEELGISLAGRDARLGSFRECVEQMARRSQNRGSG